MQIKKFEAPTMQEALDAIKRELGPEAIILQTRRNRKGFGLMSNGSVEITAAIADKAFEKKRMGDRQLPQKDRDGFFKMPAEKQKKWIDKVTDRYQKKSDPTESNEMTEMVETRVPEAGAGYGRNARILSPTVTSNPPDVVANSNFVQMPATPAVVSVQAPVSPDLQQLKKWVHELRESQSLIEKKVQEQSRINHADGGPRESAFESSPALTQAFEQLVLGGVDRRLAYDLIKRAQFELGPEATKNFDLVLDSVAAEIVKGVRTKALGPFEAKAEKGGPRGVLLVGASGVGKTTFLLKMATLARGSKDHKVAFIHIAPQRLGQWESLEACAKIFQAPFRVVSNAQELRDALRDLNGYDTVFMDSSGLNAKNPEEVKTMTELAEVASEELGATRMDTLLAVSCLTRDSELNEFCARLKDWTVSGLGVSRLDEASVYGTLYNLPKKSNLPLMLFSTGTKIPSDLEAASPERVAALILDI